MSTDIRSMKTNLGWSSCIALALSLSACAGTPVPAARVASAHAAVRGASEVGAADVPRAALHQRLAREQIARADVLIRDGDNDRAELVLERAESDAELALALAREDHSRHEAQLAVDRVRTLRRQVQQGGIR